MSAEQMDQAAALPADVAEWIVDQQALIIAKRMEQGLPISAEAEQVAPAETREEYRQERRADVAARVREWAQRNAECGPIPMVLDAARRDACEFDLERFGYTYMVGRDLPLGENPRPPSPIIREYIRRLQTAAISGGSLAVALPRGYGKTAWAKIAAVWAAVYGHADYIVVLAANDPKAKQLLANIKQAIEQNELLLQDFPAVCHPVRALAGNVQRCASQLVDGLRTRIEWGVHWVVLPAVRDSKASGNIIACYSIDSGFHGIERRGRRPKLVIGDDVQTEQTAKSPSATGELEHRIVYGAMGLGGHDRPVAIVMVCTCIEEGDLSDRFLDPATHPEFAGIRMRLMLSWPERQDLWDAYADLWREDQRNSAPHLPLANAYYAANRAEMDKGGEISDPELYDRRQFIVSTAKDVKEREGKSSGAVDPNETTIANPRDLRGESLPYEQSALQHAWNLRLRMGETAYFSQIENAPRKARGAGYDLSTVTVASRCNGLERHALPPGARGAVVQIDVNPAAGLRWAIVAASRNMTCAVLDYGRYPARGRLCPPNVSELESGRRVYAGLAEVLRQVEAMNLPIRAMGIDRGFQGDTIHAFCRNTRARFPIVPAWGFAATKYRPESKYTVGTPGHYCHMSESPKGQFLAVQVDYWRELVQRSFLALPLSPGSLSLWGKNPNAHQAYAENITAEMLADKAVGAVGTFWKWHSRPGAENHWLDATVGCYALLSWFRYVDAREGLTDIGNAAAAAAANRPKRYKETRRAKVSVE
ncbi:MAG: terminase gpA endonuclease subunit [bacterium]